MSTLLFNYNNHNIKNVAKLKYPKLRVGYFYLIQWKPFNVITLGQRETDNINRMITISKLTRHQHKVKTSELGQDNLGKFDHNKRMITLSVITLSGFHCIIIAVSKDAFN